VQQCWNPFEYKQQCSSDRSLLNYCQFEYEQQCSSARSLLNYCQFEYEQQCSSARSLLNYCQFEYEQQCWNQTRSFWQHYCSKRTDDQQCLMLRAKQTCLDTFCYRRLEPAWGGRRVPARGGDAGTGGSIKVTRKGSTRRIKSGEKQKRGIPRIELRTSRIIPLDQIVRKVISGSGNRSNPRPDRGRLPCMAVGPLSRNATIKEGKPVHGNKSSSCPQCSHKP
jgi:hypothetical protein